jgi:hypothetical protein
MGKFDSSESYSFDKPGKYRVCVEGYVNERWSDKLGGMKIKTRTHWDDRKVTTLVGEMVDQAALAGMLNSLYELHLTLLSVDCLKET